MFSSPFGALQFGRSRKACMWVESVFDPTVHAPKGLYGSARGFNPGNRPKPYRALMKGRKIDWPKDV
jgi:hypothetical protein